MSKFTRLLVSAAAVAGFAAPAYAAPIMGSFSLLSFGGTFIGGSAMTATGLDFGDALTNSGNGYGTAGTAFIGNQTGDFIGLGPVAFISDIALGAFANPFSGPFLTFAGSDLTLDFANASFTRSALGTSINITGTGVFSNGVAADAAAGTFALAVSSQGGKASSTTFTYSANASTVSAVPETATWAMMLAGFGAVGFAMRRRQKVATRVSYAA